MIGEMTRDDVDSESAPAPASEAEASLVVSCEKCKTLVVCTTGNAVPLTSPFAITVGFPLALCGKDGVISLAGSLALGLSSGGRWSTSVAIQPWDVRQSPPESATALKLTDR